MAHLCQMCRERQQSSGVKLPQGSYATPRNKGKLDCQKNHCHVRNHCHKRRETEQWCEAALKKWRNPNEQQQNTNALRPLQQISCQPTLSLVGNEQRRLSYHRGSGKCTSSDLTGMHKQTEITAIIEHIVPATSINSHIWRGSAALQGIHEGFWTRSSAEGRLLVLSGAVYKRTTTRISLQLSAYGSWTRLYSSKGTSTGTLWKSI